MVLGVTLTYLQSAGVTHHPGSECLSAASISPVSAPCSSVPWSSVLPSIATLAVYIPVLTVTDVLAPDVLLAGGAVGALLVVALASSRNPLIVEHLPLASEIKKNILHLRHLPSKKLILPLQLILAFKLQFSMSFSIKVKRLFTLDSMHPSPRP